MITACPTCKEVRHGDLPTSPLCGHKGYRVSEERIDALKTAGYRQVRVEPVGPGDPLGSLEGGSWQMTYEEGERPGIAWVGSEWGAKLWLTAGQGRAVIQAVTYPVEADNG